MHFKNHQKQKIKDTRGANCQEMGLVRCSNAYPERVNQIINNKNAMQ